MRMMNYWIEAREIDGRKKKNQQGAGIWKGEIKYRDYKKEIETQENRKVRCIRKKMKIKKYIYILL